MLAAVFACKINTNPDQPVAITIILPDSGRVEVTRTFQPRAIALNGIGDSVAGDFSWASFDTTLQVLDPATGLSLAHAVGTARLQARVGNLIANPQTVRILTRLDSMAADSLTSDTLDATVDSLSNFLRIKTFAFGGPASNRRVFYAFTTYPESGPVITLEPRDTVTTGPDGKAAVQVRLHPGTLPDSVVVTARMLTFHGDSLPGSPVTFVVEFKP